MTLRLGNSAGRAWQARPADRLRLLCLPGSIFGSGQEGYLRAAFANIDSSEMPEIVRRLGLSAQP